MALYDNTLPLTQTRERRRELSLSGWDRTKLGLTGYREDGSTNFWGDAKGVILPTALGIVGGIYGGPMGAKAGSALGQAASKGLSSLGGDLFEGTDTIDSYNRSNESNQLSDMLGGTIGSLAGNVASGLSDKTDSISNIFRRRMDSQGGVTPTNQSSTNEVLDRINAFNLESATPNLNNRILDDYRMRTMLNRNVNPQMYDNQLPIEGLNTSITDLDRMLGYNLGGVLS